MGNWTRVRIEGYCIESEVPSLRRHLEAIFMDPSWGPLHNGGLAGLPNWGLAVIDVVGNLGERGFDSEDVADALRTIGVIAPSLFVRVHMGGDYESAECVATVELCDGKTTIGEPKIKEIPDITEEQMEAALFRQLSR